MPAAVAALGVRHTEIPVSQDGFLDNMRALVANHDAPVYTISYYVHWQLMQAVAAHGYKVSISGTAADELFTGYYDHHNLYLYELAKEPELHAAALAAWREHQAPIVRNPYLQQPDLYLKNPGERRHIYLGNEEFSSWLHKPWMEDFTETDYGTGLLRKRMLNELFAEAVPVILHEDDLNAMYFSIENRSPFLDRRLFDIAYSIPARHLIQDGRAKSVLREATCSGIVPDAILDNRRKVGFNAPILDLLDPEDPKTREFLLDDSPVFDLVRKDRIEALLKSDDLANSASKFLFYFVNMKMFLDEKRDLRHDSPQDRQTVRLTHAMPHASPPAPIALFAYRRRDHLAATVQSLLANAEASRTALVIFCDGAKGEQDRADVAAVCAYAAAVTGFASLEVVARPRNFGLAASIIDGVTTMLTQHERVIVVEDDLVVSRAFSPLHE